MSSGQACLCHCVLTVHVNLSVWAAGVEANFKTNFLFLCVCCSVALLCVYICVQCFCMLLASVSVAVSKWVVARGRSCGSQQNYIQVRDALYGTNPYYQTISLSCCSTHTAAVTCRQEKVNKHGLLFTTHNINVLSVINVLRTIKWRLPSCFVVIEFNTVTITIKALENLA